MAGQRPPLSCRTSPPRGGRSNVAPAFANLQRCRIEFGATAANLPQVGEMAGRPEGGAKERGVTVFQLAAPIDPTASTA
ncbi:hypothetical protein EOA27_32960 [Mesorhizobium sp. M2A.F.Ca.ET.037.01.1.1]|nr:hypothetical protein EJ072_01055 [Mesorhizobium sp. M2A.F.Ca.ET.046.03.2.1]RUX01768.1 hypothetical protein EOA27_32960 [Mesorhizobium sp. M2A.F.Ca.ET.037.01.1.1]RUX66579.1 hypothetical protein EOA25_42010 [Mesorhizobium sp. M2A.F.Ca.ET.040.01.1.1]RWA87655.1 MAG: hypothetical protein EOQ31_23900 [Mesorhizobium sp.]RWX67649.1 hypothetical protein EOA24_15505 [Mesorhizobium sp. M2A.F.Ca.ET.039.01.1.1]